MLIEPMFPVESLKRPTEERLSYFDEKTVLHKEFERVAQEIKEAITIPNKESLRTLVGQTGVGKSEVCKHVVKEILKELYAAMTVNKSMIPIIMMKLLEYPFSHYYWVELFKDGLVKLCEPLIELKVDYEKIYKLPRTELPPELLLCKSNEFIKYLKSYMNALKYRETETCIWDEAGDITKTANSRMLLKHLNFVKSLADHTEVLHILAGPFELYTLSLLNGQLIRRNQCIHFRRYRPDDDNDVEAFIEALLALLSYIPLKKVLDPMPILDFFLERSVGSIGILKQWLYNSVSYVLGRGGDTLDEDSLRKKAKSGKECRRILLETTEKEKGLEDTKECIKELQDELGLNKLDDTLKKMNNRKEKAKNRGKVKPFKRKPFRDAVGY
jgi:archaellum biogenesis ATPase FlaH